MLNEGRVVAHIFIQVCMWCVCIFILRNAVSSGFITIPAYLIFQVFSFFHFHCPQIKFCIFILAVSFYSSLWSRPLLAFAVTQIQRSIMLANYLIISFTFGFLQIYSKIFSLDNNKVLLYIHIYVYIQYMYVCINIYFLFFEKGSAA